MLRKTKDDVRQMIHSVIETETGEFKKNLIKEIKREVEQGKAEMRAHFLANARQDLKAVTEALEKNISKIDIPLIQLTKAVNESIVGSNMTCNAIAELTEKYDKIIDIATTPTPGRGGRKKKV